MLKRISAVNIASAFQLFSEEREQVILLLTYINVIKSYPDCFCRHSMNESGCYKPVVPDLTIPSDLKSV